MNPRITILLVLAFNCQIGLTNLVVHSPQPLKRFFLQKYKQNSGSIPFSIANFGDVPYGKRITGQVQIPSVLQNCIYEDMPNVNKTKKIILSERNDCKFTQKALNSQKEGGLMSLIMDSEVQYPGRVVMIDDGHGSQIHIPTILISKQDGQAILDNIKVSNVSLSIYFQTEKTDKVSIDLYLDIADRSNYVFLRRFQPYYNKIKDHVNLNIHYATIPCTNCLDGDCFYNGTYCKKILYSWIDNAGQMFINEQLRELFIFKNQPNLWWKYMEKYDEECSLSSQQNYLEQCSIEVMKSLGINSNKVLTQVKDSFGENDNQLLRESYNSRLYSQVIYYPTIVVNNVTYRGNLQPYQISEMVCNSLTTPPDTCSQDIMAPVQTNVSTWIILSVVGFVALLIFILFCYRRIVRRQITNNMNKQVNQLVNQYITMYEADKFKGDQDLQGRMTEND